MAPNHPLEVRLSNSLQQQNLARELMQAERMPGIENPLNNDVAIIQQLDEHD